MKCYLVRHAQTTWNAEGRIQGHANPSLSALGLLQAERLGERFADRPLAALYSSHLQRSRQTAEAVARQAGVPVRVHEGLAEIYLGRWEGLLLADVETQCPELFGHWQRSPSTVEIPEAEPFAHFRVRILQAFDEVLSAHRPDEEIVVVSHGGVISAWLAEWLGARYDIILHQLVLDNAGVSVVDVRRRPPSVLGINDVRHLSDCASGEPLPVRVLPA